MLALGCLNLGENPMGINKIIYFIINILLTVTCLIPSLLLAGEKITKPWVTGYLPAYEQQGDAITFMSDKDWETVTHVIHFAGGLHDDGSLNFSSEGMSASRRAAAISKAHEKNVPILFSVLAWYTVYEPVINDANKRAALVAELINVLKEGYDGIDLDLEPVRADDSGNNPGYEALVDELHTAMKGINKTNNTNMLVERPLLAIATGIEAVADNGGGSLRKLLAKLQDKLDQINVMGYDLSTLDGEVVWHDSALYDGGQKYPTYSARSLISVSRGIQQFIDAGVLPAKLGLGMSFEIRIWHGGKAKGSSDGVTEPVQQWDSIPKNWNSGTERGSFANLMNANYACMTNSAGEKTSHICGYSPDKYRWDDKAKVSYLSINNTGSDYDAFISYNDARSVREKVEFAKEKGLGGVMIWHLGLECVHPLNGNNKCVPADGRERPLLNTIRKVLRTGNCD